MTSHRKKETFWTIKKTEFFKVEKIAFFWKGFIQPFNQKSQILLYLDLAIIRLEKLLSHFAEKKETFLTTNSRIFQTPKNRIFFFKGVNPCFWPKILFFLYFDLIKIRLGIMLSDFQEKKTTFFDHKKQRENFWKSKKSHFFKGVNPCSWTKNANFSFN